jgi:hypothetical protein
MMPKQRPVLDAAALEFINFDGEYSVIPERMRQSIMDYIIHKKEPGHFISSVICNNLRGAVGHADEENLSILKQYVHWFYNVCPSGYYGNENFMEHLGLK